MTKNFHRDGLPTGPWAVPARSPEGQYGIAFGEGEVQIGFIIEDHLEAFIHTAMKDGERDDLLGIVVDAAATLAAFKANSQRRQARRAAVPNN